MSKMVTISTSIDSEVKEALSIFCRQRGLKIQHFVEKAIVELLEDEIDLADYHARKEEETISFGSLLKK